MQGPLAYNFSVGHSSQKYGSVVRNAEIICGNRKRGWMRIFVGNLKYAMVLRGLKTCACNLNLLIIINYNNLNLIIY